MKNSPFWDVTVPRIMSIYANAIFAVLWVGFALALVVNREWLDVLWNWLGALPLAARIFLWLVFLPITVGLWIWESDWSVFVRLVGLVGIIGWTLVAVWNLVKVFRRPASSNEG